MDLDKLAEEIKADEGVIYEIYNDHLGYKTCGGVICVELQIQRTN